MRLTKLTLNPHFSQEIYWDAKSTHACCVGLPQTPRRTYSTPASASVVRLASMGIFDISLRSLVRNAGFKILDISLKNNLLRGHPAKVNSTEAFVNTSVMVRPAQVTPCGKQAAGSWIILTLRILFNPHFF
jgi:hypothetical protein